VNRTLQRVKKGEIRVSRTHSRMQLKQQARWVSGLLIESCGCPQEPRPTLASGTMGEVPAPGEPGPHDGEDFPALRFSACS
jgi:hypothetical protein